MWQHTLSNNRNQVNPDRKPWILLSEFDRLFEGRSGDHQACAGKDPFLVGADDRFVHFLGHTEIISVYDQSKLPCLAGRRREAVCWCFRQKRASSASTLCKGSARLSTRSWMLTTHRLAWACTNSLRFA